MRDYDLRSGKKETRFVNFPFTVRDVFTKKIGEEKKKKRTSFLLSIYVFTKTKCYTIFIEIIA
jgi:hypothetical protein